MFTYSVQLAGYPYERMDEKGPVNYDIFLRYFDAFPWLEQLDALDQLKEGASATLFVNADGEEKQLWVSIAGSRQKSYFLVGYVYTRVKKALFGFGKEKQVKWVDIYEAEDDLQIKYLYKIFFDKKFDKLAVELDQLNSFDSMEAYI